MSAVLPYTEMHGQALCCQLRCGEGFEVNMLAAAAAPVSAPAALAPPPTQTAPRATPAWGGIICTQAEGKGKEVLCKLESAKWPNGFAK